MPKTKIIRRVYENKSNKQKLVTIPKHSDIKTNDFVSIKKVEVK